MSIRKLPPLYVICDADACRQSGWALTDFASACLDGGARLLQIRAKNAPSGWLLDCTAAIVGRARAYDGSIVIVNDRADIARLTEAHGVHVGQDDLTPTSIRSLLGDQPMVGLSTHTPVQAKAAMNEPITYLAVGPVFGTTTKATGYDAVGVERVREASSIAASRSVPVVAIGGITLETAQSVLDAGADSVAVITDLLKTGDPTARVRDYVHRLQGYNRDGDL